MKNTTKFFAIAFVILGFAATSFAQNSTASAKILAGLTITKQIDLNFGTMTVPTAPTTVTLSTAGVLSNGGNITLLSQTPIAAVASYDVSGDNNANYAITLPLSTTIVSGGNNMVVNNFLSSGGVNHTLNATGQETFTVGATLNLGAAQAPGSYTGTYDVTVAYN